MSSVMWKYFHKLENGGTCKLCNAMVKTCGNTTNLKQHLKRKHPTFNLSATSGKYAKSSVSSRGHVLEEDEDDPLSVHQSMVSFTV